MSTANWLLKVVTPPCGSQPSAMAAANLSLMFCEYLLGGGPKITAAAVILDLVDFFPSDTGLVSELRCVFFIL
jgi:hypothetical protein